MNAVIVTGDRHATSDEWGAIVRHVLEPITDYGLLVVITGGATGIDTIAEVLAAEHRMMSAVPMEAQWNELGLSAGPKRNAAMLRVLLELREHGYASVAVHAFHSNLAFSKGTRDMVTRALRAGTETHLHTLNISRKLDSIEGGKS